MQQFTFESKSSPGTYHTTTINDEGNLSCTCRGFLFRGGKACTHMKEVVTKLGKGELDPLAIGQDPNAPSNFIHPMLASECPEGIDLDDYDASEWVLEEKFDGHRLIVEIGPEWKIKAWSRLGKERELPPHIIEALESMPLSTLDGEIRVPGGVGTDVKALDNSDKLEIVFFDILKVENVPIMDRTARQRREYLKLAGSKLLSDDPVRIAEQFLPRDAALQTIWDQGGEGAILKNVEAPYIPGKRTREWIKLIKGAIAEATITGFKAGELGPHSIVTAVDDEGNAVSVKALNDLWRANFAENSERFIGRRMVFSYREKTRAGAYKHAMAGHILD